jgi:hypothetical protein
MATPTTKQKQQFIDHVFSDSLEWATDWIQDHMTPEEVFGDKELKQWIQDNKNPEEVFDEDRLTDWAKRNGYTDFS